MLPRRALLVAAAVVLPFLAAPSAVLAHSLVRPAPGLVTYLSADATSLNTLTVSPDGDRIAFRDPTVDGGMDPGSCEPGKLDANGAYIVETFCPAGGVRRLRLDMGEREDSATVTAAISATLLGGSGADRLTGGPAGDELAGDTGDDTLAGAAGDDVIDGGIGSDRVDAGPGTDTVRVRDGIADDIRCGAGTDTVEADTLDVIADDCERPDRVATAPPPGVDSTGDKLAPQLRATAAAQQRISASRRTVSVIAVCSEPGAVAASGALDVAGLALPAAVVRKQVTVAGEGVVLRYKLTNGQLKQALKALRKKRRVTLRLSIVATDRAGNSREIRLRRIRLVR